MKQLILTLLAGMLVTNSFGQDSSASHPSISISSDDKVCNDGICCCSGNSQAPLGVMTDHIHGKGTWMFSYTYMNTSMQGNYIGTDKASDNTVYKNYMMAPETMSMHMHMAMLMYGVTDRFTVMAMGGYMVSNMSMSMSSAGMNMPGMVMPAGSMNMQTQSSGITDTRISGLYNFSKTSGQRIIGSLGISLPTGSIKATGVTILGDNQRLAYDMQQGTGSWSIEPDITYARKYGHFYWGANVGADIRLNYNSLGYKDGNVYHGTAWAGYQFLPFLSATFRAEDVHTNTISGYDPVINNPVYQENDPTTRTSNYGGTCINTYVGLNFYLMKPVLDHFRLMAEYGIPVYQNLNGTQMAAKANLLAGLQYSF
jgi:hypothetical protein